MRRRVDVLTITRGIKKMKTQVMIDGYFSMQDCEKLKEKLSGKTYMQFEISYSNYAGNCNLIVSTSREDTDKKELLEMFVWYALSELAKA